MRLLIAILLFSSGCFAQAKYYVYLPIRTYHFERGDTTMMWYHNTEGGNLGAVLVRQGSEKLHSIYSAGFLRNSYGVFGGVLMAGAGYNLGILNVTASAGLATGYGVAYERSNAVRSHHTILSRNGILPQVAMTFGLNKGIKIYDKMEISPMLVVSPIFVNGGLKLTLN